MTEELKQKAEERAEVYVDNLADERHFPKETEYTVGLYEGFTDGYFAGATEATKELQEVIKKQDKSISEVTDWMYDYKGNLEKARWLLSNVLKLLENYKKTNDLATVKEIKNFLKETE